MPTISPVNKIRVKGVYYDLVRFVKDTDSSAISSMSDDSSLMKVYVDANENNVYVASHSDVIKMAGEEKTLTEKIGGLICSGTKTISSANSTIIFNKTGLSISANTRIYIHTPHVKTSASSYRLYVNGNSVGDFTTEYAEYTFTQTCNILKLTVLNSRVIIDASEFSAYVYYGLDSIEFKHLKNTVETIESRVNPIEQNFPQISNLVQGYNLATGEYVFTGEESASIYIVNKTSMNIKKGSIVSITINGIGNTISSYRVYINDVRHGDFSLETLVIDATEDITKLQVVVLASKVIASGTCSYSVDIKSVNDNFYEIKENIKNTIGSNQAKIDLFSDSLKFEQIEPEITWNNSDAPSPKGRGLRGSTSDGLVREK